MRPSTDKEVREMYDETAESYTAMMDAEIGLPMYAETLSRFSESIANVQGVLIDTSCGSGHMLSMYRDRFDRTRQITGVDLSPRMVAKASIQLGSEAEILVGDMRDLVFAKVGSAAGVISFFAIHHLDPEGARLALHEWHRVLTPGGQLLIAAWEGAGPIDYGGQSDIVAFRSNTGELSTWARSAGFFISHCVVELVDGMEMDAIYLYATRQ